MTGNKIRLEHSEEALVGVHSEDKCLGQNCAIHNMSDHNMRSFPQHWREDRGMVERICPHGVGHPDPDDPKSNDRYEGIHGCDGCCSDTFWLDEPIPVPRPELIDKFISDLGLNELSDYQKKILGEAAKSITVYRKRNRKKEGGQE